MPYYPPATASGAPIDATYITQTANGTLTAEQNLAALATGLLKSTTTTGALSIGVAGTDYPGLAFANVFTAAQTQQGSGNQYVTIRSTTAQAGLNVVSQAANAGDWLFGTGANAALGVDAFFIYSQLSPAGFKFEIDKSGQVYISSTLSVGTITVPTSPVTPLIYVSGTNTIRASVNSDTNSGFGFHIGGNLKWSAAAYLPSGTNYSFVFYNDQMNVNSLFINGDDNNVIFGSPSTGGSLATYARVNAYTYDATTAAIVNELAMIADSSGTPGAGFGAALRAKLKSSTTIGQDAGRLYWLWPDADGATHGTRRARGILTAYSVTTERECIAWEATSTAALIGVLGASPIARQAHIVDADGTLADATTKINSLLAYLENFGFIATS